MNFENGSLYVVSATGKVILKMGQLRGSLAIHRELGNDRFWTVTHAPTGCALPVRLRSRIEAAELAILVAPYLPKQGFLGIPPLRDVMAAAVAVARDWALGKGYTQTDGRLIWGGAK